MQSKYNVEGEGEYILRFTDEEFAWFKDIICDCPCIDSEHPSIVRALEDAYQRGVGTGDLCAHHWYDHGNIGLAEDDKYHD